MVACLRAGLSAAMLALVACSAVTSFDDFVGPGDATVPDGSTPPATTGSTPGAPPPPGTAPPPTPDPSDASSDAADAEPDAKCNEVGVGPRVGTTAVGWPSATNALVNDDVPAELSIPADSESANLEVRGFGFAIPENATITAVELLVHRSSDGADIRDEIVCLLVGGSSSTDVSKGDDWTVTSAPTSYSRSAGSWGVGLTPSAINASSFGARVRAKNRDLAPAVVSVDAVEITVRYCLPN